MAHEAYCLAGWKLNDAEATNLDELSGGAYFEATIDGTKFYGIANPYFPLTISTFKGKLFSDAARTVPVISGTLDSLPASLNKVGHWEWIPTRPDGTPDPYRLGHYKTPALTLYVDGGKWVGHWIYYVNNNGAGFSIDFVGDYTRFPYSIFNLRGDEVSGAASGLAAGDYYFRVCAVKSGVGRGGVSKQIKVTISLDSEIDLQWIGVVGATSYEIYGPGLCSDGLLKTVTDPFWTYTGQAKESDMGERPQLEPDEGLDDEGYVIVEPTDPDPGENACGILTEVEGGTFTGTASPVTLEALEGGGYRTSITIDDAVITIGGNAIALENYSMEVIYNPRVLIPDDIISHWDSGTCVAFGFQQDSKLQFDLDESVWVFSRIVRYPDYTDTFKVKIDPSNGTAAYWDAELEAYGDFIEVAGLADFDYNALTPYWQRISWYYENIDSYSVDEVSNRIYYYGDERITIENFSPPDLDGLAGAIIPPEYVYFRLGPNSVPTPPASDYGRISVVGESITYDGEVSGTPAEDYKDGSYATGAHFLHGFDWAVASTSTGNVQVYKHTELSGYPGNVPPQAIIFNTDVNLNVVSSATTTVYWYAEESQLFIGKVGSALQRYIWAYNPILSAVSNYNLPAGESDIDDMCYYDSKYWCRAGSSYFESAGLDSWSAAVNPGVLGSMSLRQKAFFSAESYEPDSPEGYLIRYDSGTGILRVATDGITFSIVYSPGAFTFVDGYLGLGQKVILVYTEFTDGSFSDGSVHYLFIDTDGTAGSSTQFSNVAHSGPNTFGMETESFVGYGAAVNLGIPNIPRLTEVLTPYTQPYTPPPPPPNPEKGGNLKIKPNYPPAPGGGTPGAGGGGPGPSNDSGPNNDLIILVDSRGRIGVVA